MPYRPWLDERSAWFLGVSLAGVPSGPRAIKRKTQAKAWAKLTWPFGPGTSCQATIGVVPTGRVRSALAEHNLDWHWRNARTHTLHDPVRWKYAIIGNYRLNGVTPPLHAWS